jgi:hypothetical protein
MPMVKVTSERWSEVSTMQASIRVIIFGVAVLLFFTASAATAQINPAPPRSPIPPPRSDDAGRNQTPMGSFEEEIRAKRAIKLAEKDHKENLQRARELSEIAKALQGALKDKTTIDRNSLKKLERLEKLTKKIRSAAGGEGEQVNIVDHPKDITSAINQIAERADSLSKNVQDTPRQVVSASVIGNANVLLELVRLLRSFGPR